MVVDDPLRHAIGVLLLAVLSLHVLCFAYPGTERTIRFWALASFVGHSALATAIWYLVPSQIAGDAVTYEAQALGLEQTNAGKEGFSVLLGSIYRAFGHVPVAGLFLNGLWMGLLVLVVSSTARRLGDQRAARIAALIAVFLPPFIWWGSQLLREASMWLLIALVADTAVRVALDGLVWRRGVWLLVLFLAMVTMRAPVAAVLAIALGLGLVLVRAPRPGDHLRRIVLIGGSVLLAAFLLPRFAALQSLGEADAASYANSRNILAEANTGFGQTTALNGYALVGQLPVTFPLVALGPLPWQLPATGQAALADTLAWWFIVFWALRGLRPLHRRHGRVAWLLLLPALLLLVVLALTLANWGIVIRMRAMIVVLLIPYASVGLAVGVRRHAAGHTGQSEIPAAGRVGRV